jgi:hypothetical protein
MATKKWFGLAAVVAAIGGATAYVLTKVREDPEKASYTSAAVSLTPAAALYDAAKTKLQRDNGSSEGADAEKETVAS